MNIDDLKEISRTHVEKRFLQEQILALEEEWFLTFIAYGVEEGKAYDAANIITQKLIVELIPE